MNDTIAAVATSGGPIGIIRVSGEQAIGAVSAVFAPKNGSSLADAASQKLVYGTLFDKSGHLLDACYAVVFRAPHTYTGENMAEIQCHGSTAVMTAALDALFAHGVRQAEAGEFTRRAFLDGKMGLSEAEAVHDLITSRTVEAAQNAAAQMMGAVGSPVQQMRENLLGMVAHFHAVVDFPDEDIDPVLFDDAAALLHKTTSQLYRMAESYERGRILREGVPCVILGRPNAGKSTLLNTLLGRERAIVTDIPGTTRDLIEENVKVGQILLRVTDTAGLRDTTDPIEQAGIDRAMAEASASALILAAVRARGLPVRQDGRGHGAAALAHPVHHRLRRDRRGRRAHHERPAGRRACPRRRTLRSGALRRSVRHDAGRRCDGRGGRDCRARRDHRRNRDRVGRHPDFQRFLRRQVTQKPECGNNVDKGSPAARSGPFFRRKYC